MSFRCSKCKKAADGSPIQRVVETREKRYPARSYKAGGETIEDPGGYGTEIVREANFCKECAT